MHDVFDTWMKKNDPDRPWCRCANDGLIHLKTEREAQEMLLALKTRFEGWGLILSKQELFTAKMEGENRTRLIRLLISWAFRQSCVRKKK